MDAVEQGKKTTKKIMSLTKEQEDLMPVWADKWIKIGLSTEPLDLEAAKKAAKLACKNAGLECPDLYFYFDSPVAACVGEYIVKLIVETDPDDILIWDEAATGHLRKIDLVEDFGGLIKEVAGNLLHEFRMRDGHLVLGDEMGDVVTNAVRMASTQILENALRNPVVQKGTTKTKRLLSRGADRIQMAKGLILKAMAAMCDDPEVKNKYHDLLNLQIYGCHDAHWLSYYEFMWKVLGIDDLNIIEGLVDMAHCSGWWSATNAYCIFQHRPEEVNIDDGVLHKDMGPSIRFRDGFSTWTLNGVRCPKWLVMTRPEEIDPVGLMGIDNAQVRAEGIKKMGNELFVSKSGATVIDEDPEREYWLLRVPWTEGVTHKALKMKNPSVPGMIHIEFVDDDCMTVRDAIHARKPEEMKRITVDDVNGEDYVQQGDVLVWPDGAKSLKFYPAQLT